jgi:EmrB/QacA subfamily drug resistance transporter
MSLSITPAQRPQAKTLILWMVLIGQLMIILDVSIITTALPSIEHALHFSPSSLSWVQNAYTLTFGGLLLLGARLGDIFGRRRIFTAGIAVFSLASLAGGLAQSSEWLLIARAVQGVAGAVTAPSTLALLTQTFREPAERSRAIALFSSVMGAGASFGLVVGGLLTDLLSWRWGLFINVPIGAALVMLAPRYLPETQRKPGHFDLVGAVSSTAGMAALVYGFVRAATSGWTAPITLVSFVAGVALLVAFVFNELKVEQPITPLHLFASRERSGANFSRLLMVGGMFSMFFFVTQYLQGVLDFSPIQAGLAFLPLTGIMFGSVQVVPRFAARLGNARTEAIGIALAFTGMIWISRLGDSTAYFPGIALPMLLLGAGMGTAFIPATTLGIAGVEPQDAGAASGLVNVAQQLGGSLGLAILVSIFGSATRSAQAHPVAASGSVLEARHELAHGVGAVLTGSSVFLALALAVVVLVIGQVRSVRVQASESFEAPVEMAG